MKTKKTFKRIAAAVAAVMMMCAVPVSMTNVQKVSAYDITIDNVGNRSFVAYQIFKGDLSSNGAVLSNINWATSVDGTAIINALKSNSMLSSDFSSVNAETTASSAAAVSEIIKTYTKNADNTDNEKLVEFAKVVDEKKGSLTAYTMSNGKISTSNAGYYLIVDTTPAANLDKNARSRYILEVVADTTVAPKVAVPELNKVIVDNGDKSANIATLKEDVNYKLTSKVPDMTGYNKYFFIIDDTLSDGLVLNYNPSNSDGQEGFTIKIAGANSDNALKDITGETGQYTDTNPSYYVVQDGQKFKIVFNNFLQYKDLKDNAITIEYSAALGGTDGAKADKVKVGSALAEANTNTAKLIYSNDPNFNYKGDDNDNDDSNTDPSDDKPNEPDPGKPGAPDDPNDPKEPVSNTPEKTVYTYTAKVKIHKYYMNNGQKTDLTGASFKLSKDATEIATKTGGPNYEFIGLEPGTYKIEETVVPDGYNKAPDYNFNIVGAIQNDNTCQWTVTGADASKVDVNSTSGVYFVDVENKSGATLPGTGGIGTTIFYISGGVLVLGAGVVLITKKRMSLKDEK